MNFNIPFLTRLREAYRAGHEPENLRLLAEFYWRAILVCTFFTFVGVICFGVWDFISITGTIYSASAPAPTPPAVLDRSQLDAVLKAYDARASEIVGSSSHAVPNDPSR